MGRQLTPHARQWVMHSMNPTDKKEVKAKSLKALEKLGHHGLVMDEYESENPSYARCQPTECPGPPQAKLPQK